MALNFPNTPTDGQRHTEEGVTYEWSNLAGVWTIVGGDVSEFLPVTGGTLVGPVTFAQGATVQFGDLVDFAEEATFDKQSIHTLGLAAAAPILLKTDGDKTLGYQTAAGVQQATVGWNESTMRWEVQHGTTTVLAATGGQIIALLDALVSGNLIVNGTITSGGNQVPTLQEFIDPAGLASWRIIGTVLEVFGTTATGAGGSVAVTFPKTFDDDVVVTTGGGDMANQPDWAEASNITTTGCTLYTRRGSAGDALTGPLPVNYHAIGKWDGVS